MAKKAIKKSDIKKVPAKKSGKAAGYSAEQIQVLEGLEPVKKRPGMYIGSTGPRGLHHLVWEVVDNGIDEAMAGHATSIQVTLNSDNSVSVRDNGRGIPVDVHKQQKVSALELVMTKLHAGGKFGGGGYKVSGGLHGVGVSVVNALSEWTVAEVHRDGNWYIQEYAGGTPKYKVKKLGKISAVKVVPLKTKEAKLPVDPVWQKQTTGTRVTFKPDANIFETVEYDWQTIIDHLRRQAYLTKGIKLIVQDLRSGEEQNYQFYFEGGIATYVRYLNRHKEAKQEEIFYTEKEIVPTDSGEGEAKLKSKLPVKVELAFQYTDDVKETIFSFANNIINPEGGMHLVGFRTALTRTLNNYARSKGYLKEKDQNLQGEDVREGITSIISVKVAEPQFEGQTKAKLGNPEVRPAVDQVVSAALVDFLETRPREAEKIVGKIMLAQQARLAAKSARDAVIRKGALEGLTLPGKLADCSSRDTDKCEIYIVEGDSAGGSAKQGRNREFQAILPLRGKVLNVERARLDKLLANNELKSLIIALGTNIGEQFDISGLRYGKVIIMTDADVDGSHIRTLLLTFFFRYLPELITQGHLYVAQPPLYSIKKGKEVHYAYTEDEKEKLIKSMANGSVHKNPRTKAKLGAEQAKKQSEEVGNPEKDVDQTGVGENIAGVNIQRYKGLGEMNPEQLWNTTMDPEQRLMKQVTVEDLEKADDIFDVLMGSEVLPRKKFIQTHAQSVENLDI
jgi:DNA gyrase subunit B